MRSGTRISGDNRSEKVGIRAAYHHAGADRARRAEAAALFLFMGLREICDLVFYKVSRHVSAEYETGQRAIPDSQMLVLPISDSMKKRPAKNSSKDRLSLHNYAMAIPENHK